MEKRQIINIINFIRDYEPRVEVDLVTPVVKQIELMRKHGLPGTFLLQYDALCDPVYTDMLRELDPSQFEIGAWFEIVQGQCEDAGVPWKGRWAWDWYPSSAFSVGYTKDQRERLADTYFSKFWEVFGRYPRVLGAWFYDTHTIRYITSKYGLDALCNCKEQYGTDGYTLWGGYYGQGYYPSSRNVFIPSQDERDLIKVPVFRMLGSDPVYQYDFGLDPESGAEKVQDVISLEPVYTEAGGGNPQWVDWYLKENFNGRCLSFGYAQTGQENSFGWEKMGGGLTYQLEKIAGMRDAGQISVEKLGDTGRWYTKTFSDTPASAICAETAYDDDDVSSVWYCSKRFRINLFYRHGIMRIRDLHVFSPVPEDPYEDKVCTGSDSAYESLPVLDGNRHTGKGILGGALIGDEEKKPILCEKPIFSDTGRGKAELDCGPFIIKLSEEGVAITSDRDFRLIWDCGTRDHIPEILSMTGKHARLRYMGVRYSVDFEKGFFGNDRQVLSENGRISFSFS